jgi:hypothetical protein
MSPHRIMPGRISQFAIGISVVAAMTVAFAIAVAVARLGPACCVVAPASVEQARAIPDESPTEDTDFRLSEHQQLRRILLGK